jgi:hypothetical protein
MFSARVVPSRLSRVVLVVAAVALTACADRLLSPAPVNGRTKAARDIEGDTTLCRTGWSVMDGRYVCNAS